MEVARGSDWVGVFYVELKVVGVWDRVSGLRFRYLQYAVTDTRTTRVVAAAAEAMMTVEPTPASPDGTVES